MNSVQFAMKKDSISQGGNLRLYQLFHKPVSPAAATATPIPVLRHMLVDKFSKTVEDDVDHKLEVDFESITVFLIAKMAELQENVEQAEGGNSDLADLARFIHKEQLLKETDGDEKDRKSVV
jgi:hypothetical protein